MTTQLAEDLRRFLIGAVASVPHLEALLLLHGDPQQPWTIELVARRLYVQSEVARALLSDLETRRLVSSAGDPQCFLFDPNDQEVREMVDRLAGVYSRHVVEVAKLLHAKDDQSAQLFADAFRIRKEN